MRGETRRELQRLQMSAKRRQPAMLPADSEDFSNALREAFPSIKFIRRPSQFTLRRTLGRDELRPEDLSLFYCDSLAQDFELGTDECFKWDSTITAWLEPEGWEPFWIGPTPESGNYVIANKPRLYFSYGASGPGFYKENGNLILRDGFITSTFPRNDKEFKSFINKVWRILSKLTTNVFTHVDRKSGRPYGPAKPTVIDCCGLHAMDWMREAPNRYVISNCRPPEDGDKGPYAPLPEY